MPHAGSECRAEGESIVTDCTKALKNRGRLSAKGKLYKLKTNTVRTF